LLLTHRVTALQSYTVYRKAIEEGIPCQLHSTVDFFESPEIKAALALLRCLVDPLRAGDNVRKRLVNKSGAVKVPLMAGLGARMQLGRRCM
jgi:superfamily I DNA/RNA helicase